MSEFELRIGIEGGSDSWYTEHRFDERPNLETVRSLKDEAESQFLELFPDTPVHNTNLSLSYVDTEPEQQYVLMEDDEPIEIEEK